MQRRADGNVEGEGGGYLYLYFIVIVSRLNASRRCLSQRTKLLINKTLFPLTCTHLPVPYITVPRLSLRHLSHPRSSLLSLIQHNSSNLLNNLQQCLAVEKVERYFFLSFLLLLVVDNNLSSRVLARVVLSVIAKSFVITSKVSPSQLSVVSPAVVV